MKRILLVGANFKNKGAEAMAITAVRQFTRIYPEVEITIASYAKQESIAYGMHSLSDGLSFELIRNTRKFTKIFRILAAYISISPQRKKIYVAGDSYLERVAESDLVVDISGFALSDQRTLLRRLVFCFEIFSARTLEVPFVIFTQALGPFKKITTRWLAKKFLPKADLIIARGNSTRKYLAELNPMLSVEQCADSAFLFKESVTDARVKANLEKKLDGVGPIVGIIPNTNILVHGSPHDNNNPYVKLLVEIYRFIQTKLRARAIFVCHEHYTGCKDDHWLVGCIQDQLETKEKAVVIRANHSAAELKMIVSSLDFVVASRFHSVVAAISTATPFLALGWSHKYVELVEEGGLPEAVLDGRGSVEINDVLERIYKLWKRRKSYSKQLICKRSSLCKSAANAFSIVGERWPPDHKAIT